MAAVSPPRNRPTLRQRSIRGRMIRLSLRAAVRHTVDVYFRFRFCGPRETLWCDTEQVWMGRETFLHWALCDEEIDIPWVVAEALGAPDGESELRESVYAELTVYWSDLTASLPHTRQCHWLPLP